mmetsp:Transcript_66000/g.132936  ORF Transcript_66000/g.132936 Transcript_66000/m.132936 type:complete len:377 (+) Transcript_66000:748-1878(+)
MRLAVQAQSVEHGLHLPLLVVHGVVRDAAFDWGAEVAVGGGVGDAHAPAAFRAPVVGAVVLGLARVARQQTRRLFRQVLEPVLALAGERIGAAAGHARSVLVAVVERAVVAVALKGGAAVVLVLPAALHRVRLAGALTSATSRHGELPLFAGAEVASLRVDALRRTVASVIPRRVVSRVQTLVRVEHGDDDLVALVCRHSVFYRAYGGKHGVRPHLTLHLRVVVEGHFLHEFHFVPGYYLKDDLHEMIWVQPFVALMKVEIFVVVWKRALFDSDALPRDSWFGYQSRRVFYIRLFRCLRLFRCFRLFLRCIGFLLRCIRFLFNSNSRYRDFSLLFLDIGLFFNVWLFLCARQLARTDKERKDGKNRFARLHREGTL